MAQFYDEVPVQISQSQPTIFGYERVNFNTTIRLKTVDAQHGL